MFNIDEIIAPPKTFSDAVAYLHTVLDDSTKDQIRRMTPEEAEHLLGYFGTHVQQALGFHDEHSELFQNCLSNNTEDATQWILYALWFMLKTEVQSAY